MGFSTTEKGHVIKLWFQFGVMVYLVSIHNEAVVKKSRSFKPPRLGQEQGVQPSYCIAGIVIFSIVQVFPPSAVTMSVWVTPVPTPMVSMNPSSASSRIIVELA